MRLSEICSNKRSCWIFGVERKFQRDKRCALGWSRAASRSFFCLLISLLFSLSLSLFLFPFLFPSPIHTAIVAVITIFLRPLSLSSNDLSIEPRVGNHRTSANGTANGCVLLVPLHLPHYTQFSAGDLIGFSLLILLPRSPLPACSSPLFFFVLWSLALSVERSLPFGDFWLMLFGLSLFNGAIVIDSIFLILCLIIYSFSWMLSTDVISTIFPMHSAWTIGYIFYSL